MQAADMMIAPGMYFDGTRNDGRSFKGQIEKVSYLPKGTMIVVKTDNGYKSLYLTDLADYKLSDFSL